MALDVSYTAHAVRRMRQRLVLPDDVVAVFTNPAKVEAGAERGTWVASGFSRNRPLGVVYRQPERARRVVVTAYWTDEA